MPNYRRHFENGQTVFLTLVTLDRQPWLSSDLAKGRTLEALRAARLHHPFKHLGHVLLDDHLHLLLRPFPGVAIPKLIGSFKRATHARLPELTRVYGRLWQPRYNDHVIRDEDDFARHLDYLHFNPVKHGLISVASEWPWSSFSAWQRRGIYPDVWGVCDPERIRRMHEWEGGPQVGGVAPTYC